MEIANSGKKDWQSYGITLISRNDQESRDGFGRGRPAVFSSFGFPPFRTRCRDPILMLLRNLRDGAEPRVPPKMGPPPRSNEPTDGTIPDVRKTYYA